MTTGLLTHRATVVASGPDRVEVGLTSPCGGCKVGCLNAPKAGARMTVSTGAAATSAAGAPVAGTPAAGTPVAGTPVAGTPVQLAVSRSGLTKACALVFGFPLGGWLAATVLVDAYWGEAAASLAGLGILAWMLVAVRAFRPALRRWANIELIPLSNE